MSQAWDLAELRHCSLWFYQQFPSSDTDTMGLGKTRQSVRRRRWHPTPVLLPGKSHGWRSLVGCSPWGHAELDTTERLSSSRWSVICWFDWTPGKGAPFSTVCPFLRSTWVPRGSVVQVNDFWHKSGLRTLVCKVYEMQLNIWVCLPLFKIYIFIYLAVSGLSGGTWDLPCEALAL